MPPFRPIAEIEKDFTDVLASRLPAVVLREKLELLWDEANIAAGEFVLTAHAAPYLSLLNRMQETFERRDFADRFARRDDHPW